MNGEFLQALEQIAKEKGISKELLIDAIDVALVSAFKKNFGTSQNVKVQINRETGEVDVYALKTVVEEVDNEFMQISLQDAKEIDKNYEAGNVVETKVTPKNFGRIAAQTAKQVVVQRIREAERGIIFDEYISRENEIVTGLVQRKEKNSVFIDLGKTEAILGPGEQTPNEVYNIGDRIKTYIVEVKKTTKGPQIILSRTHPGLVKRLFELEVPEIQSGIVEIKSIAREAGSRTKIAVYSHDENIDPVGACVGQRGHRVQVIVDELKGEKIDIIQWSNDPEIFVGSALSPAKVIEVFADKETNAARVVVGDSQLSLAIGKEGQNARLAAKLTGWKIDIKSQSQAYGI
ncbi:MAG TPA: transcription termination factor NusA [Bacillota bacterium]|nr:transcription termination factor NusA [Bacillota bacterium]HNT02257.1 transcription termination factor NusA [Bacillota bacterium]HPA55126.1 transcription termination factor NusA [Bacillota bacterium]HQO43567.1 transcription termination factor NusA [Bacillota bacterium]HQQ45370.1 transcription termination factor NusA [Bacillota bacterium]